MKRIETAKEIISELGGNRPVAEIVGCKPKAVSNWKKSNSFPARTFLSMKSELEARGIVAPPSLWGMS